MSRNTITLEEIGLLAIELAAKTSLGATCSNMQIRGALDLLNQRGYLRNPPADHPVARRPSPDLTKEHPLK